MKRLDSIIVHFLKAIRPTIPDFKELNLLDIIEEILHLKEKELSSKKINIQLDAKSKEPLINGDLDQLNRYFLMSLGMQWTQFLTNLDICIIISWENDYISTNN